MRRPRRFTSFARLGLSAVAAVTIALSTVGAAPKDKPSVSSVLPAAGKKGTVLLFLAQDCPISNQYAPEMGRIMRDYSARGVRFYAVYTDTDLSLAAARKHARAFGLTCPVVVDARHQLARHAGATVTPEVAVYTPDGMRRYRGRIDDRYLSLGRRREQVTRRDLRLALDAILSGKPVAQPTTRTVGCFVSSTTRE